MPFYFRKREVSIAVVRQTGTLYEWEQHFIRELLFSNAQLSSLGRLLRLQSRLPHPFRQANEYLMPLKRWQKKIQGDTAGQITIEAAQNPHAGECSVKSDVLPSV
jgi:hypothetical protein